MTGIYTKKQSLQKSSLLIHICFLVANILHLPDTIEKMALTRSILKNRCDDPRRCNTKATKLKTTTKAQRAMMILIVRTSEGVTQSIKTTKQKTISKYLIT